jgi:hypothetical protein
MACSEGLGCTACEVGQATCNGNMAHVWSNYEARNGPHDPNPERRGINSIQLFRHADEGWRIIHMIWDNER